MLKEKEVYNKKIFNFIIRKSIFARKIVKNANMLAILLSYAKINM